MLDIKELKSIISDIIIETKDNETFEITKQKFYSILDNNDIQLSNKLSIQDQEELYTNIINLWNKCVDIHNNNDSINHIEMRKMTCKIIDFIKLDEENDEIKIAFIKMRYQTSKFTWNTNDDDNDDQKEISSNLIGQCYESISFLKQIITENIQNKHYSESLIKLYFKIILLKSQISRNEDKILSEKLLIECKDIACNIQLSQELRINLTFEFIETILHESSLIINQELNLSEAIELLDIALELSNQNHSIIPIDQDILKQLHLKILKALCSTYILLNDGSNASKCLFELEKFNGHLDILDILKFKVFMCLNDIENAKMKLLDCISNDAISKNACIQAFEEIWTANDGISDLTFLKQIFKDLHLRFKNDLKLPLQFFIVILNTNIINDEIDEWSTKTLVSLYSTKGQCSDQEIQKCCYILLWNAGTIRYENQLYIQSINYFKVCLELVEDRIEKSKVTRILALNYLAIQEYIKCIECMDISDASETSIPACNCFIRFKVSLLIQDNQGCLLQLKKMTQCHDFKFDMLKIACEEASLHNERQVSRASMFELLNHVSNENTDNISEAIILRCLIQSALDEISEMVKNKETSSSLNSLLNEISHYFENVITRLNKNGINKFFNNLSKEIGKEIEWFANNAWNLALSQGTASDYQKSSDLFKVSFEILEHHPSPMAKHLTQKKSANLLCACSKLELIKDEDVNINANTDEIQEILNRSKSIFNDNNSIDFNYSNEIDKSDIFILMMEFKLSILKKSPKSQIAILKESQMSPMIKSDHVMKMVNECKMRPEATNEEVMILALQIARGKIISNIPIDNDKLAYITRSLIQIMKLDKDKINIYKETIEILKAPEGNLKFKENDGKWFIVNCWNLGCHHARFSRWPMAEPFMSNAIELCNLIGNVFPDRIHSMKMELERVRNEMENF